MKVRATLIAVVGVVMVVAAVALSAGSATAASYRPVFSAKDRANALALVRSTSDTSDPNAYVWCGIRHQPAFQTGTRYTRETLECVRYGKPMLAKRYHLDKFVWWYTGAGLWLTTTRDGKVILDARVAGLRALFHVVDVICGKGVKPCPQARS
jgi:hypothetical protein